MDISLKTALGMLGDHAYRHSAVWSCPFLFISISCASFYIVYRTILKHSLSATNVYLIQMSTEGGVMGWYDRGR